MDKASPLCPADRGHRRGQDAHKRILGQLSGVTGMGGDEHEAAELGGGRADFGFRPGDEVGAPTPAWLTVGSYETFGDKEPRSNEAVGGATQEYRAEGWR